ncbi:hypothetical protein D3C72_2284340 [compost metagenome]
MAHLYIFMRQVVQVQASVGFDSYRIYQRVLVFEGKRKVDGITYRIVPVYSKAYIGRAGQLGVSAPVRVGCGKAFNRSLCMAHAHANGRRGQ